MPYGKTINGQFSSSIVDYTCEQSKFETSRNYISLSHIHLPVEDIIRQYESGFQDSREIRLRCYKGYQMEADLMARIVAVHGDKIKTDVEISAYGGLVKGHPDFSYLGYPGDCKSVPLDEHLPVSGKLPRKVYWQMQAYMLYMSRERAIVVYESRETGKIIDFWIRSNFHIQTEIGAKLDRVVELTQNKAL